MRLAVNNAYYTRVGNATRVILFCRKMNGERRVLDIPYEPYCYIRTCDVKRVRSPSIRRIVHGFYSYPDKEPLSKLYFTIPYFVGRLRRILDKKGIPSYEADVPFERRFMIDREIRCGIEHRKRDNRIIPLDNMDSRLRYMIFDIEVATPSDLEFSALERWAKHEIVAISYWDSKRKTIRVISQKNMNEKELIEKFISIIDLMDPDVFVGYNIEGFDIPYLMRRCRKLGIPIGGFSPVKRVYYSKKKERWEIKGRTILDYARAYRDYVGRELRVSWFEALEHLGKKYLGISKVPIDNFEEVWKENPTLIEERAKTDVKILVELEKLFKIIPLWDEVRKEVGCMMEDVFFKSIIVDVAMLRYTNDKGVLPNKPRREDADSRYTGAYVKEPAPGVYRNILLLDFSSFYPNIILKYNISPETLDKNGDLKINDQFRFSSTKRGMLPILVGKYLGMKMKIAEERDLAKDKRKSYYKFLSVRHEAIKRVLNSFYGASAYSTRLKSIEIVEAITQAARDEIQKIETFLEKTGSPCVYADTDSSFIQGDEDKKKNEEIVETIKAVLPEGLEMGYKKTYRRIVFLSKKRYMGIDTDGNIDRVGIQSIRSDTEDFIVEAQDTSLMMMLEDKPKKEIGEYVNTLIGKIRKKKVPVTNLARPVQLKKHLEDYKVQSFHVQGIKYSEEHLGVKFYPGMKPRILRIKETPSGFPKTRWIAIREGTVSLPPKFQIDFDFYAKRLVKTMSGILELLGMKLDKKRLFSPDQTHLEVFLKGTDKKVNED